MIRLLAPAGTLATGAVVELDEDESRHLTVRRAEPGAPVQLLDGSGLRADGRLGRAGKGWNVEISQVSREPAPVAVTLAVGAGDRERFGMLVEQAAQLGATGIIPLQTDRTTGVSTRLRGEHLDRIRRRGREALKQCGGAWAPEVSELRSLPELLAELAPGARWLADPEGGPRPPLNAVVPLTIAVGPEGGFSSEERQLLLGAGFRPVRLGRHLLRFETAALAALTAAWLSREEGLND
ncbi:MAG: 16S rRNA (uracil(1498)-N(3))-methyltransferase [Gemmatimonadota bacterium]|nr:16S rRNA (uracil(1498)-N(3))-methyltransferase [Gemmatimonadota bacterium]MDH4348010.1 16S rRNA (uracil(1498)-N(3))-methyltransferase [Gemmatimonadota bacterium]MDH5283980.1 16S rRNA (uracil(1498)-N(3))-methyltransferase [Gemmatimonadota bacterium]